MEDRGLRIARSEWEDDADSSAAPSSILYPQIPPRPRHPPSSILYPQIRSDMRLRRGSNQSDNRPRRPGIISDIMHDDIEPLGAADDDFVLLEGVERVLAHLNGREPPIAEPRGHSQVAEERADLIDGRH